MKHSFFPIVACFVISATSAASEDRFDPEPHLYLQQCWDIALSSQLDCLDSQLASCDMAADASGVPTSNGRYACGHEIFEQVDARLNMFYPVFIANAKFADVESGYAPFREEMVRSAQRKWIDYRDEMCNVRTSWARTGSGADSVIAFCSARLTLIQLDVLLREIGR